MLNFLVLIIENPLVPSYPDSPTEEREEGAPGNIIMVMHSPLRVYIYAQPGLKVSSKELPM